MGQMISYIAIVGLLFVFSGCEKTTQIDLGTPEATVKSYIRALKNRDVEAIEKVYVEHGGPMFDTLEDGELQKTLDRFEREAKSMRIAEGTDIWDDKARVYVWMANEGDKVPFHLEKTDEGWKLK